MAAVLFGTTGTARALGAHQLAPAIVGGLRIALGACLLAVTTLVRGRWPFVRALLGGRRLPVAVVGMAGVAAYQVFFFAGVAATGVALGTLVAIGSGPVCAGLLGFAIRERPSVRWAVATVLAVIGGAVLLLGGGSADVVPVGVLLAFGAGISYAVLTVAGRWLLARGTDGTDLVAVLFTGAAVLLLPLWVGRDLGPVATPSALATIAWLGVFATAVPYPLFARGLKGLPAASVTTLTLAEPLTATLLAVVVLGERPGLLGWLGAALITAGLLVVAVTPRNRSPSAPMAPQEGL